MVLTYGIYLDLLAAIDEYTNCKLTKDDIQTIIFKHYAKKYNSFIAVNSLSNKMLFYIQHQRSKNNKNKLKQFKTFMNDGKYKHGLI